MNVAAALAKGVNVVQGTSNASGGTQTVYSKETTAGRAANAGDTVITKSNSGEKNIFGSYAINFAGLNGGQSYDTLEGVSAFSSQVFTALDVDNDSKVTVEEAKAAVERIGVDFSVANFDKDEYIEKNEIASWLLFTDTTIDTEDEKIIGDVSKLSEEEIEARVASTIDGWTTAEEVSLSTAMAENDLEGFQAQLKGLNDAFGLEDLDYSLPPLLKDGDTYIDNSVTNIDNSVTNIDNSVTDNSVTNYYSSEIQQAASQATDADVTEATPCAQQALDLITADKDFEISSVPDQYKSLFSKFDQNNDGKIDASERAMMKRFMQGVNGILSDDMTTTDLKICLERMKTEGSIEKDLKILQDEKKELAVA